MDGNWTTSLSQEYYVRLHLMKPNELHAKVKCWAHACCEVD